MADTNKSIANHTCPNCGSADIDTEPSRGDSVCINCGSVVEDVLIVSEVGFQEENGAISAIGTFVNEDGVIHSSRNIGGSKKYSSYSTSLQDNEHKKSNASVPNSVSSQNTLARARNDLNRIGSRLKISSYCLDTAFNFYKLALFKGITRGRRHPVLYGALLYLVCRLEGTTHLLLDFSDALSVSIFDLGKYYLKLSSELCINAPVTDPALYIPRFAQKLELGKNTHDVVMTALRLINRMKKDWIHAGRRPSGLCGAALLVAARLHNFNRTTRQIVDIVRIRETTLKKRLKEFAATPSAALSLTEFFEIDLEEECDPPSFAKSKLMSKQMMETLKFNHVKEEIKGLQTQIEQELAKSKMAKRKNFGLPCDITIPLNPNDEECTAIALIDQQALSQVLENEGVLPGKNGCFSFESTNGIKDENIITFTPETKRNIGNKYLPTIESLGGLTDSNITSELNRDGSKLCTVSDNTITKSNNDYEEATSPPSTHHHHELYYSDIDDDEIEALLLGPHEVAQKTQLWERQFGPFMEERRKAKVEKSNNTLSNNDNIDDGGKNTGLKSTTKSSASNNNNKSGKRGGGGGTMSSGNEGMGHKAVLTGTPKVKKMSAKINYDVLKDLLDPNPMENDSAALNNDENLILPTKKHDTFSEESQTLATNIKVDNSSNSEVTALEFKAEMQSSQTSEKYQNTPHATWKRVRFSPKSQELFESKRRQPTAHQTTDVDLNDSNIPSTSTYFIPATSKNLDNDQSTTLQDDVEILPSESLPKYPIIMAKKDQHIEQINGGIIITEKTLNDSYPPYSDNDSGEEEDDTESVLMSPISHTIDDDKGQQNLTIKRGLTNGTNFIAGEEDGEVGAAQLLAQMRGEHWNDSDFLISTTHHHTAMNGHLSDNDGDDYIDF